MHEPDEGPKIGQWYFSVVCRICGSAVPLSHDASAGEAVWSDCRPERARHSVKCPYCNVSDEYRTDEIRSRLLDKSLPERH